MDRAERSVFKNEVIPMKIRNRNPSRWRWSQLRFALLCLAAILSCAVSRNVLAEEERFQPSDEVRSALLPLFTAIADADVSRAKVELAVETVIHGEIVSTERSTFQIASKYPDKYTIYHKAEEERKRVYSDGESSTVAVSKEAYYVLPEVLQNQAVVTQTPINLGAYPEPMLALTIAGVDPSITLLGGMRSVDLIDKPKFRGRTDSVHFRGEQDDGVVWDLWISDEERPRPLRLLIDLTPMLAATGQVRVPEGYKLSLRYDFVSWRMTGQVADNLFRFEPPGDAVEYESLADYQAKSAERVGDHPLLGENAPDYRLTRLDGTEVSAEELDGKVVVLDFWATWCTPCLQAIPVIESAIEEFDDSDVVFFAVNVGENPSRVSGYLGEQDWNVDVAVDPEGKLMNAFSAEQIPLTLLIAPSGIVEAAHVGYPGEEALRKRFKDELEVLTQGGRIASSEVEEQEEENKQTAENTQTEEK